MSSSPSRDSSLMEAVMGRARLALRHHQVRTAVFLADKAHTVLASPASALLLAEAYYADAQYQRVLDALQVVGTESLRATHLAARSLLACRSFDECIELLEAHCNEHKQLYQPPESPWEADEGSIDYVAGLYLIRGQAYHGLDNRPAAAKWWRKAIDRDAMCYEALECLAEMHMLSAKDGAELTATWDTANTPLQQWFGDVYSIKINTHSIPHHKKAQKVMRSHGLALSADCRAAEAEMLYYNMRKEEAFAITESVLATDPHNRDRIFRLHVCLLTCLGRKTDLYHLAHRLVDQDAESALSWYAVGCFYYVTGRFEYASTYFQKASVLDPSFGASWIAFAHCFAAQGDHDQALVAYRTAARIMPSSHLPLLCIAMEHIRTLHLKQAVIFLSRARELCPYDPLVLHEEGVVAFHDGRYEDAIRVFEKTLSLAEPMHEEPQWEATTFNLGHAYRRCHMYDAAACMFQRCIGMMPYSGQPRVALGFVYHLRQQWNAAVDMYQQALSLEPGMSVATTLLRAAMRSSARAPIRSKLLAPRLLRLRGASNPEARGNAS